MTAAEYREAAAAYDRIIAEWVAEQTALYQAGDAYTPDIEELRAYQAALAALASTVEGQERYKRRKKRA